MHLIIVSSKDCHKDFAGKTFIVKPNRNTQGYHVYGDYYMQFSKTGVGSVIGKIPDEFL